MDETCGSPIQVMEAGEKEEARKEEKLEESSDVPKVPTPAATPDPSPAVESVDMDVTPCDVQKIGSPTPEVNDVIMDDVEDIDKPNENQEETHTEHNKTLFTENDRTLDAENNQTPDAENEKMVVSENEEEPGADNDKMLVSESDEAHVTKKNETLNSEKDKTPEAEDEKTLEFGSNKTPESEDDKTLEAENIKASEAENNKASEVENIKASEAENNKASEAENDKTPEEENVKSSEAESDIILEAKSEKIPEVESDKIPEAENNKASEVENDKTPEAENVESSEAESEKIPEAKSEKVPEAESEEMPESENGKIPEAEGEKISEAESEKMPEAESEKVPEAESDKMPEAESEKTPDKEREKLSDAEIDKIQEAESDKILEAKSDKILEAESDKILEAESDKMSEAEVDKDKIMETENDKLAEAKSVKMPEADSDEIMEIENDKLTEAESVKMPEADSDEVMETENDKLAEAERDKKPEADSDKIMETENNKLAEAEIDKITETENNKIAETENDKLAKAESDKVTENNKIAETLNVEIIEIEIDKITEKENNKTPDSENNKTPDLQKDIRPDSKNDEVPDPVNNKMIEAENDKMADAEKDVTTPDNNSDKKSDIAKEEISVFASDPELNGPSKNSDENKENVNCNEEPMDMDILRDEENAPPRLIIKGFEDDEEEFLVMTVEEIQDYLMKKVASNIKDPKINPVLVLKNHIVSLQEELSTKKDDLDRLNKAFEACYKDQIKFLRHIGVMEKIEMKSQCVGVDLPWLTETMPSGYFQNDVKAKDNIPRPSSGVTITAIKMKKDSGPVECIDLTDEPDTPEPPKSTPDVKNVIISNSPANTGSSRMNLHPAPLPNATSVFTSPAEIPPKPRLQISVDPKVEMEDEFHEAVTEMQNKRKLKEEKDLIATDEEDELDESTECPGVAKDGDYVVEEFAPGCRDYIPLWYKEKVVALAEAHPKWNLKTLQKRGATRLKNMRYLSQWKQDVKRGGTNLDKWQTINQKTYERFKEAQKNKEPVTTKTLQKWAVNAALPFISDKLHFIASKLWVERFKKQYGIR